MVLGRDLQTLVVEMSRRMAAIEKSYLSRFSPVLSPSELSALRLIVREVSLQMGDLARGVGIPLSSATNLVDKLYKRGLVTRTRPDANRRIVTLHANQEAQTLIQDIEAEQVALCDDLVAGIAGEEAELIRRILAQLVAAQKH